MTKAGNKGGNLRDKLDGNELDLSLSDLNEVPVKELVSIVPRGPGARQRPALALAWAASFLIPQFLRVKIRWGAWDYVPWEAASGPSVLPGMYTCHFGTVPEDGGWRRELLVWPWGFLRVKSEAPHPLSRGAFTALS